MGSVRLLSSARLLSFLQKAARGDQHQAADIPGALPPQVPPPPQVHPQRSLAVPHPVRGRPHLARSPTPTPTTGPHPFFPPHLHFLNCCVSLDLSLFSPSPHPPPPSLSLSHFLHTVGQWPLFIKSSVCLFSLSLFLFSLALSVSLFLKRSFFLVLSLSLSLTLQKKRKSHAVF